MRLASLKDHVIQSVMEYVRGGWPTDKELLSEGAREYWSHKDELSVENGILFKNDRAVIPRLLCQDVLQDIHGAHLGESKSLSFAKDYVFWPGMCAQIREKVRACQICQAFRNNQQRETLHPHPIPDLPWSDVGTDLFEFKGQNYIIVTDFYSKYFELELLTT